MSSIALMRNETALQRLALAPCAQKSDPCKILESLHQGLEQGKTRFLTLLMQQGLGELWYETLQHYGLTTSIAEDVIATLKQVRRKTAIHYLLQCEALRQIDRAFEAAGIHYAAFKGVQVRELIYADPSLRPADDIDILIAPRQRDLAAHILLQNGFQAYIDSENVSHEAYFLGHQVGVDLHWDLMRPGRTRIPLATTLLRRRCREAFFWGLNASDTLFILLVHPAFTKYVSSPNARLCRLADLHTWLSNRAVDWDPVLSLLDQSGLKTAAWLVLYRLSQLAGTTMPTELIGQLQPTRWRRGYLRYWLDHNLPSRWLNYPLLIQIAFTLFLHDQPSDALIAIQGWLRHRQLRHQEKRRFSAILQSTSISLPDSRK